jgi:hypothetical protein
MAEAYIKFSMNDDAVNAYTTRRLGENNDREWDVPLGITIDTEDRCIYVASEIAGEAPTRVEIETNDLIAIRASLLWVLDCVRRTRDAATASTKPTMTLELF